MNRRGITHIVSQIGGTLRGPGVADAPRSVAPPDEASPADVTLYVDRRFRSDLARTRALVALTDEAHGAEVLEAGLTAWIHPEPDRALAALVDILHPESRSEPPEIDPERGVCVASSARIGPGAILMPGCVIHAGVTVGDGSRVGEHAVISRDATLGGDCIVGPGAYVGPSTLMGERVTLGPGAVVGSEGFGLRSSGEGWIPVRHVGRVEIGNDVSIGARSVVARGTLGTTRIGRGTRIDAQVQVGHNVRIGAGCAIAAQAGIAGSTVIGDNVMIGGQAGIADHVRVGDGARIAARSGVAGDVPAGATVEGYPAVDRWKWLRMMATLGKLSTQK